MPVNIKGVIVVVSGELVSANDPRHTSFPRQRSTRNTRAARVSADRAHCSDVQHQPVLNRTRSPPYSTKRTFQHCLAADAPSKTRRLVTQPCLPPAPEAEPRALIVGPLRLSLLCNSRCQSSAARRFRMSNAALRSALAVSRVICSSNFERYEPFRR